ncbi:glyoxylase-like metal-dependent hydrolase (beta-lactamase superfamily II) [Chitinophaga skermanii]|uniref:Glyoxylase-like metal-dependent hydrolase (Beta-lactamase superfamily II) n=1 Tax=Chitinophaga skermanii TaxID=331697 RepID=A0A327QEL7_9BACT|nr:rhodanese-like domain-containing protein [Chitinophaga skermanii]RAJ02445.1 glyoxylase-like metal-dependent hydrolase (beta-lactamase superfamily II) [Chitinophaga skermanii]
MIIEQIYTGCLAQGAYYIESNGEAAVIDPLREVKPYLQKAVKNKATIKYVLETHFHADFVSGHIDLAAETGAKIVYGPLAQPAFDAYVAKDGEILPLGNIFIKVIHTPGHTMESTSYLLLDEEHTPKALFSGDTLFIGDVGRPDLAQKAANKTQEELAGLLYDSLRDKIMTLPGDIIVYPAHGAGSACGKNMSKETSDTLQHQLDTNYALRADLDKATFIKEVTTGLTPPPAYFPLNVMMNKQGYDKIEDVLKRGQQALDVAQFEAIANETGALLLDTRDPQTFAKGFIPNSINIGIDGNFAPWVGTLIPSVKQEILLITEPGREEEVITRLARVGYDYTIGYLKGGFAAWQSAGKEIDAIPSVPAIELKDIDPANILDVRKASEFNSEHIIGATNVPLDYINDELPILDKQKTYYVHCAGGYRSMIFNSILRARGYDNLVDVQGGFKSIKESGNFNISAFVCPTTML